VLLLIPFLANSITLFRNLILKELLFELSFLNCRGGDVEFARSLFLSIVGGLVSCGARADSSEWLLVLSASTFSSLFLGVVVGVTSTLLVTLLEVEAQKQDAVHQ